MKITSLNYNYNYPKTQAYRAHTEKTAASPAFTSLFADANGQTEQEYAFYTLLDNDFRQLKGNATRIFRELPSQIGISKLIDPDKKTQINVLGCSDGSEAWAYAIVMKEELGEKAKNVQIKAVDLSPAMISMAKTGKIVVSDIERHYANGGNTKDGTSSPIRGEGWDKHLIKSTRPENFDKMLQEYPYLKYVEFDPAARKAIGQGLDWYEINKEGLPEVEFICDDMRNHATSNDNADAEVYVIANSGGYLAAKSVDNYIKLFSDIKKANEGKGKDVYMVVGDLERRLLNPDFCRILNVTPSEQAKIKTELASLGFKQVAHNQLKKRHVENFKDASSKIYKLN